MRLSNEDHIYYIYTLIDPITEQIRYVGITYRPQRRLKDHIQRSIKLITHRDKWIQTLIKNNQLPMMDIIDECSQSEIGNKERFWILLIKSFGFNLTNHSDGGEGLFNPTPETRTKLSKSQIGKKHNCNFSPEYRQRKSEIAKNLNRDSNFCQAISNAKKNVPQTVEHKRALAIKKMKGKKVLCVETGELFETLIDIAQKYKISTSTICTHLRGRNKTCKGLHFKYIY